MLLDSYFLIFNRSSKYQSCNFGNLINIRSVVVVFLMGQLITGRTHIGVRVKLRADDEGVLVGTRLSRQSLKSDLCNILR